MVVSIDRWSLYRGTLVLLKWPMEQPIVVSIDRWSLYRGTLVLLKWPMEQPIVVSIDRWSLYRGTLVLLKWPMEQPIVVSIDRWSFCARSSRQASLYFPNQLQSTPQYTAIHFQSAHLWCILHINKIYRIWAWASRARLPTMMNHIGFHTQQGMAAGEVVSAL